MIAFDRDNPLALVEDSDETTQANAALNDYALLGEGRSLALLALEYQSRPKVGQKKPPTRQLSMLKTWSSRFDWQARVAAYDEIRRAALRQEVDRLWVERQTISREQTWKDAQQLRAKVAKMLEFPVGRAESEHDVQTTPDGKTTIINKTIIMPSRWSFYTVAQMLDIASKLERLAVELPTERQHLQIDGLTPKDLETMSRDELELLRMQLQKKGAK